MKDLWNKTFGPMLLSEKEKPFNSKNYIFEMKFDGIRALIYASKDEIKIISRNNIDMTYLYPELESIKKLVKGKVIFDGEIICTLDSYPSFSKLQERSHLKSLSKIKNQVNNNPVTYIVFDILYEDRNLVEIPLMDRKKILNKYKDTEYFVKSKYIDSDGIKLFNEIKKNNIEGIIAKLKTSTYEINTRTKEWIKIKNFKEESFYIGGFSYNDKTHVFSVILGEYIDNELSFVGKVFIAKKNKLFDILKKEKHIKSNFINHDEDNIKYVLPTHKIRVKYIERTNTNHLRQPFYVKEEK